MAALVDTLPRMNTSSDVLFPEPISTTPAYTADEYYGSSASTYSTYSREVKYIFEPEFSLPRTEYSEAPHFESLKEEPEDGRLPMARPEPLQDIYTPPRRTTRARFASYPLNPPTKFDIHASRRRTWSPPTCSRSMGNASSFHAMRSYRSNDALDLDPDGGNLYEELDNVTTLVRTAPPRIAPVSGMLPKDGQKAIIRPVAFKPVVTPHMRYVSSPQRTPPQRPSPLQTTPPHQRPSPLQRPSPHGPSPIRSHDMRAANQSQDEGYLSQEYNSGSHSHSTSNASQSSYHIESSVTYGELHNRLADRTVAYNSSNNSRHLSNHTETYITTPSPSDSGVGELEAMLRDKDAEIQHLRETMEKNENAIMQVYQEKKQNWEMEIKEIHEEWERRLRLHQQRAFKMEQALLLQLFKLQQERKNLKLDVEQVRTEKDRLEQKCEDLENESKLTKSKLEEIQWDMCQKTGEISHLKTQIKDSKEETNTKNNDMLGLKGQIRDLQVRNNDKDCEIERLQGELRRVSQEANVVRAEVEQLKQQLARPRLEKSLQTEGAFRRVGSINNLLDGDSNDKLKQELQKAQLALHTTKMDYVKDKDKWLDEKNKVIRYQKHLQLNYVQMHRKNKMLEAEVKQLMVEIENRDLQLTTEEDSHIPQESQC